MGMFDNFSPGPDEEDDSGIKGDLGLDFGKDLHKGEETPGKAAKRARLAAKLKQRQASKAVAKPMRKR